MKRNAKSRFENPKYCDSQCQNRPSPRRAYPGHLTGVLLRTVGNLTQDEASPVGHLTFVTKRLSASQGKILVILSACALTCEQALRGVVKALLPFPVPRSDSPGGLARGPHVHRVHRSLLLYLLFFWEHLRAFEKAP